MARDYVVVLEDQQQVEAVRPDIRTIPPLGRMVYITAPGDGEYDFVSRFFCPGEAVAKDPIAGSTHSVLIPYQAGKLNKTQVLARRVSERGGDLHCQLVETRAYISGQAITYLAGKMLLRQRPYPKQPIYRGFTSNKLVQIHFGFHGPFGAEMSNQLIELAESINQEPGFIWEVRTEDEANHEAGGVYLFQSGGTAQAYIKEYTTCLKHLGVEEVAFKIFDIDEPLSKINHGHIS